MADEEAALGQGHVGHLLGDTVRVEIGFFTHQMNLKEVYAAFEQKTAGPLRPC